MFDSSESLVGVANVGMSKRAEERQGEFWVATPSDPDARIGQMKDGRTHLNYKAEHVVVLDSEIVVQADVHHGNSADTQTVIGSLVDAQVNLDQCFDGVETTDDSIGVITEVAADKGYHANEVLASCRDLNVRTYIPEREGGDRIWEDKPDGMKDAFHGNRQRMQRSKGRNLQKLRSEVVERGFAHICETGGARRTWLRGLENVRKRHLIAVAAHNLGIVMRHLFGFSKPRAFAAASGLLCLCCFHIIQITARFSKPATVADWIQRLPQRLASPFPPLSSPFFLPPKHAF